MTNSCILCRQKGAELYSDLSDRLFGTPGRFSLMRCATDGLVWLHPTASAHQQEKAYLSYYTHEVKQRTSALKTIKEAVTKSVLSERFGYHPEARSRLTWLVAAAADVIPSVPDIVGSSVMWLHANPGGQLLDIGCGGGDFLAKMQHLGWEVTGTDPDKVAIAAARRRLGGIGTILAGRLEELCLPSKRYDAVTLNQVLEHLDDPFRVLREIRRVLRPSGRLVITTPNTESLGHRVFRRSWRDLDPPRHLYLYSRHTLRQLLEKTGFVNHELRTSARSAWEIWRVSRQLTASHSSQSISLLSRSVRPTIGSLAVQLVEGSLTYCFPNVGEYLVAICRLARD